MNRKKNKYYPKRSDNTEFNFPPDREKLCTVADDLTGKRKFPSGATSTIKPRLELIPANGLRRVANRFQLGLERHKEAAYDNLSNQAPLKDKEWLIERCSHAIDHLYNCIDKLSGKTSIGGDDDAAAVGWAGLVLAEAMYILEKENK